MSIKILAFKIGSALGIKNGMVSDINLAVKSIGKVISESETQCGRTIENVFVIVSGCDIAHEIVNQEAFINNREVTEKDLKNLTMRGIQNSDESRTILHSVNNSYALDDLLVTNPVNMNANKISISTNFISVNKFKLLNITRVFSQCRLSVMGYIASPYADSFFCLNEDDKNIGSTLINFGAGNTSVITFKNGALTSCYSRPIGADFITFDIAFAFGISLTNAEKLKILHGTLFDENEEGVIVAPNGNSEISIDYSEFLSVIKARQEEILESILCENENLNSMSNQDSHFVSTRKILMTGGGSAMLGLDKLIEKFSCCKLIREVESLENKDFELNNSGLNTFDPTFFTILGGMKYVQQKIFQSNEVQENKKFNFNLRKFFTFLREKS